MGCSSSTQSCVPTPATMLSQRTINPLSKTPRNGGRAKSIRRHDPTPTTSSASGAIHHASADLAPNFDVVLGEYFVDWEDLRVQCQVPSSYMKTEMGILNGASVVIKSIDENGNDDKDKSHQALVSEISSLARITHPNIVGFVGFSINAKGLVCLSEFMEGGTLRTLLDNPRSFAQLTWPVDKIGIAIDICSALVHMHNLKPRVIHRHLRASKVLLNKNRTVAKLSGFGGSRDRTFDQHFDCYIYDIEWSAPELIMEDEDYTEKVDVYSFGVLLTELDTGLIPFADVKDTMAATVFTNKIVSGALRPQLSSTCPPVIVNVVKHCLQQDPHIRPASDRVLQMLVAAKAELASVVE